MATSDKLAKLNQTKIAIKNAIKEKGVSVTDSDTFSSYANKIKSISGGGDTVVAYSSGSLTKGDKVLVSKGEAAGNQYNNVYTDNGGSSQTYRKRPIAFIDNNTLIGMYGSYRNIKYINNTWQVTNLSDAPSGDLSFFLRVSDNGVVSYYPCNASDRKWGGICDINSYKSTSTAIYLGEYNNKHYATNNQCSLLEFDLTSLILGETLISKGTSAKYQELVGDKYMAVDTSENVYIYQLTDGYPQLGTCKIAEDIYFIGSTGLNVGDYIFGVTDYIPYTKEASGTASYLSLYKIQSDYTIKKVSVEPLTWLESTNCRLTYDRRSKVLMVGTQTGVFAYSFNPSSKTFTEISLNLGLGESYTGDVYYAVMSPDKQRVAVSLYLGDSQEKWWIYKLNPLGIFASVNWAIVDNKTLNYQPQNVYTGIVDGMRSQTDSTYNVKVVLAEKDK
jgi:hypothetical protein